MRVLSDSLRYLPALVDVDIVDGGCCPAVSPQREKARRTMGKEAAQTKEEMQIIARKNAAARAKKVCFACLTARARRARESPDARAVVWTRKKERNKHVRPPLSLCCSYVHFFLLV